MALWWPCGGLVVALGWLCTPESMPSICLVYGFEMALGGFTHTSFRPAITGATLALASPQHPKWNQPRKGARDAKRERVPPMRPPGRLTSPIRLSTYFLISNFGAPKLISRPCSTPEERR